MSDRLYREKEWTCCSCKNVCGVYLCGCKRACSTRVRLSPDLWSGLSRRHTDLSLVTFFPFQHQFIPFIVPIFAFLHAYSWLLHYKQSTKWWLMGKPGGLPSLAHNHPWWQECQLREWRDERRGEGIGGNWESVIDAEGKEKRKVWWE